MPPARSWCVLSFCSMARRWPACRCLTGCATGARSTAVFLFAFDLLELNSQDLRREPIEVRKRQLASLPRAALDGLQLRAFRSPRRRRLPARLQDGARWNRLEAARRALLLWALARWRKIKMKNPAAPVGGR